MQWVILSVNYKTKEESCEFVAPNRTSVKKRTQPFLSLLSKDVSAMVVKETLWLISKGGIDITLHENHAHLPGIFASHK